MKELNIQAIKDRVTKGRLQGGNPTGGEDGPFHLYHLALDDMDALIVAADPAEIEKRDARIKELEAQLADARQIDTNDANINRLPEPKPPLPVFDPTAPFPKGPDGNATFGTLASTPPHPGDSGVNPPPSEPFPETIQSPRVADITDQQREDLLKVAEEHEG